MKIDRLGIRASILVLVLAPLARAPRTMPAPGRPRPRSCSPRARLRSRRTRPTPAAWTATPSWARARSASAYYLFDNVSLSLEAAGYREFITGPDTHDAWGYGLSGILRSHFVTYEKRHPLPDVAFGPLQSTARIPSGGTDFNSPSAPASAPPTSSTTTCT